MVDFNSRHHIQYLASPGKIKRSAAGMGYNPVFRIFGLSMYRMLGKTYELGLMNIKALA